MLNLDALGEETERAAIKEIAAQLAPRAFVRPSEWAERNRRMSPEASSKQQGRWVNLPMQVEPMDSCVDPEVRSTVLMWAAQTAGKTEVVNIWTGFFMAEEPSPIQVVVPDLILAEEWSTVRLAPMIRDTPALESVMDSYRSKILAKKFKGGRIAITGANAPAGLSSKPVRIALFDEQDRFPASAGKEGDPTALAEKRQESFSNAFSGKTSTPTIKGKSAIANEYEQSDKRNWFVQCHSCGRDQVLKWRQLKFDPALPADAYYECEFEECSARWTDEQRVEAVRAGRWVATAPFAGIRGYWLNGLNVLFECHKEYRNRLHEMAAEFLKAKRGGKEKLKVWTNTFLAETWEDEHEVKPDTAPMFQRRESYSLAKIPQGVRIVTAGADIQKDRIELEIVGWGAGEESWGLGYHIIRGDPRQPAIWSHIESLMAREFTREDGARLRFYARCFDSGYVEAQKALYDYIRPRTSRHFFAVKGSSVDDADAIAPSATAAARDRIQLFILGTHRIKAWIYDRATITEPGPGYMHFPAEYDEMWFHQLLMEDFEKKFKAGREYRVFSKPKIAGPAGDRNEALDCRVYAHAALYSRGVPNFDYAEKVNLRSIPGKAPAAPKPQRRGNNLLAGLVRA